MAIKGAINLDGTIENVEHIQSEPSTLRGGDPGGNAPGGNRAFGKHATSRGGSLPDRRSEGSDRGSEAAGDRHPRPSDQRGPGADGGTEEWDRGMSGDQSTNSSDASGSGSLENGSSGSSRSLIEPRRPDESPEEYKRRYDRESKRLKRQQRKKEQSLASYQESVLEEDFEVTVESEALPAGADPTPKDKPQREVKARPKAAAKKYKEPTKDKVSIISSSLQDVYEVVDNILGVALTATGNPYPQGLFCLEESKADKMGRALAQMNNSLPRLAEKVNQVSAPAIFFSVLLGDLAVKGMAVYGIIQSTKAARNTPPTLTN